MKAWLFDVNGVLDPLEAKISDRNLLNGVTAIGEKGGVWITYKNGERKEKVDEEIKVPVFLSNQVKKMVENEFSDSMFFDKTKLTMISVEMHKGYDLRNYHDIQPELVSRMSKLIEESDEKDLKIDPTTIAVDIENSHVGKALGARRFLEILEERGITPENFIAFGDSNSDFDMLDELKNRGKNVKFVYVGKPVKRSDFEKPNSLYDLGTLEYLKAN